MTKLTVFYLADMERGDNVNYFEVYKSVWEFHKKYAKLEDNDEFWEGVVSESGAISKKYENNKFVIALLLAVIDELERKAKEIRNNAET